MTANESAYPCRNRWDSSNEGFDLQEAGLTKREYFAAMALQSLSATLSDKEIYFNFSTMADDAVKLADALIERLNEGEKQ